MALTPEQADKILELEKAQRLKGIRDKLEAKKPLTKADREFLQRLKEEGKEAASEPEDDGKTWIQQKQHLAEELGVARNTLRKRMEFAHFPKRDPKKGWCLEDCQEYLSRLDAGQAPISLPKADPEEMGLRGGVAASLKRWEEAERQAGADYIRAYENGDVETMSVTLATWEKTSKQLHAFERIVAQDKRDSGELVQRPQVEEWIATLGLGLNYAEEAFLDRVGEIIANLENPSDPREIRQFVKGLLYQVSAEMIEKGCAEKKLLKWMLDAFAKGFRP